MVAGMKSKQQALRLKLEGLKAQLAIVKAEEVNAKYAFDNSEFADIESLLDGIDTEVRTRKALVDMEYEDRGDAPVRAVPVPDSILDDADAYIHQRTTPSVAGK